MIVTKYARERAKEETGLLLAHSVNRLLDAVYLVGSLIAVGDTIEIGKQLREVHRLTMLAEKFNALYLEMKADLLRAPAEPEETETDQPPAPGPQVVPLPPTLTEEQTDRVDTLLGAPDEKPVDEDMPF